DLEWSLVIVGALIAIAMELARVPALPFAVGMYLPLSTTTPIFVGGLLRWLADRARGKPATESEAETSPGVLLASGYIAGGTLVGLVVAFFVFLGKDFNQALDLTKYPPDHPVPTSAHITALIAYAVLAAVLFAVGARKSPEANTQSHS